MRLWASYPRIYTGTTVNLLFRLVNVVKLVPYAQRWGNSTPQRLTRRAGVATASLSLYPSRAPKFVEHLRAESVLFR